MYKYIYIFTYIYTHILRHIQLFIYVIYTVYYIWSVTQSHSLSQSNWSLSTKDCNVEPIAFLQCDSIECSNRRAQID